MKTKWLFFVAGVALGFVVAVAILPSAAKLGRAPYRPAYPVLEISQGGKAQWVYPKR